jgi:hypothetical protein
VGTAICPHRNGRGSELSVASPNHGNQTHLRIGRPANILLARGIRTILSRCLLQEGFQAVDGHEHAAADARDADSVVGDAIVDGAHANPERLRGLHLRKRERARWRRWCVSAFPENRSIPAGLPILFGRCAAPLRGRPYSPMIPLLRVIPRFRLCKIPKEHARIACRINPVGVLRAPCQQFLRFGAALSRDKQSFDRLSSHVAAGVPIESRQDETRVLQS